MTVGKLNVDPDGIMDGISRQKLQCHATKPSKTSSLRKTEILHQQRLN